MAVRYTTATLWRTPPRSARLAHSCRLSTAPPHPKHYLLCLQVGGISFLFSLVMAAKASLERDWFHLGGCWSVGLSSVACTASHRSRPHPGTWPSGQYRRSNRDDGVGTIAHCTHGTQQVADEVMTCSLALSQYEIIYTSLPMMSEG